MAGILLVVFPTVVLGGFSLLNLLLHDPGFAANPLRQDLWRAGHAHAGVLLILSLVALRYVDDANLSERLKQTLRSAIPSTAILLPAAFFLSVLPPDAKAPTSSFISLTPGRSFSRWHCSSSASDCSKQTANEQRFGVARPFLLVTG
jgi:hypothetical protein